MFSATIAVACVLCREGRKEKDVNNSTLNKRSFICISTWAMRGKYFFGPQLRRSGLVLLDKRRALLSNEENK